MKSRFWCLLVTLLLTTARSYCAPELQERWWELRVAGGAISGIFLDIDVATSDRILVRYSRISDSGVELERVREGTVLWRNHVQPLGVTHREYQHKVSAWITDGTITILSEGAKEIRETHDLESGKLLNRVEGPFKGAAEPPLQVFIVPSNASTAVKSEVAIWDKNANEFYVLVSNISDHDRVVWQKGSSWGDKIISFELKDSAGRLYNITRLPQKYTRNIPSPYIIPKGEFYMYTIQLNKDWIGRPEFAPAVDTTMKLRAVYTTVPSPEASTAGVWIGTVKSAEYNVTVKHR